jgi:hypothetical protein
MQLRAPFRWLRGTSHDWADSRGSLASQVACVPTGAPVATSSTSSGVHLTHYARGTDLLFWQSSIAITFIPQLRALRAEHDAAGLRVAARTRLRAGRLAAQDKAEATGMRRARQSARCDVGALLVERERSELVGGGVRAPRAGQLDGCRLGACRRRAGHSDDEQHRDCNARNVPCSTRHGSSVTPWSSHGPGAPCSSCAARAVTRALGPCPTATPAGRQVHRG